MTASLTARALLISTLCIGAINVLAACSRQPSLQCLPDRDPWSHDPGFLLSDYAGADETIRYKVFSEIKPEQLEAAIARVSRSADPIELSPAEAANFAGSMPDKTNGLKPYLVRALSAQEDSGSYVVDYYKNQLWVRYEIGDTELCKPASYHEALVVWLPQPPAEVAISEAFVLK